MPPSSAIVTSSAYARSVLASTPRSGSKTSNSASSHPHQILSYTYENQNPLRHPFARGDSCISISQSCDSSLRENAPKLLLPLHKLALHLASQCHYTIKGNDEAFVLRTRHTLEIAFQSLKGTIAYHHLGIRAKFRHLSGIQELRFLVCPRLIEADEVLHLSVGHYQGRVGSKDELEISQSLLHRHDAIIAVMHEDEVVDGRCLLRLQLVIHHHLFPHHRNEVFDAMAIEQLLRLHLSTIRGTHRKPPHLIRVYFEYHHKSKVNHQYSVPTIYQRVSRTSIFE